MTPISIPASPRLISLDALRGFTIAAMIMVNSPGSWSHIYAPLAHKAWNGITPTDLIFPFFIFVVGVSIALAYGKKLKEGKTAPDVYRKIIIRSLKIFAVGVFLNLYPSFDFADVRIAGVLQRIAIVFMVCALLFLTTGFKKQAIAGAFILIAYWISMTFISTPGYEKPMLEPGINLASWVDSFMLPGRMWQQTWDPEGLFSTLPAIASGITGLLAGALLNSPKTIEKKISFLLIGGILSLIAGYLWSIHFPLNKNLWTSSYVLVSSGYAAISLAVFMYLLDKRGNQKIARPFVIFGSNAITVYVLAWLADYLFSGINFCGSNFKEHFMIFFTGWGFEPKLASMMYALFYTALMFIPAWMLFRKKIFIKL
jgi:predicted acyltransferase